jgi:hypothetical protein
MWDKIASYRDLNVFQNAMNAAMKISEVTKGILASIERGTDFCAKVGMSRMSEKPLNLGKIKSVGGVHRVSRHKAELNSGISLRKKLSKRSKKNRLQNG